MWCNAHIVLGGCVGVGVVRVMGIFDLVVTDLWTNWVGLWTMFISWIMS